jgi:putative membrane protein
MRFLVKLAINALAIYAAVALLNRRGLFMPEQDWVSFIWLALIFAIVNAVIKPILQVVGCPFVLLTLGLFTLVINTFLFYITAWIGKNIFQIGFEVQTLLGAFLGSLIVSVVSYVLNQLIKDKR